MHKQFGSNWCYLGVNRAALEMNDASSAQYELLTHLENASEEKSQIEKIILGDNSTG